MAASVGDNAQVEMDSQYAAMLAERIAHEEVSESITIIKSWAHVIGRNKSIEFGGCCVSLAILTVYKSLCSDMLKNINCDWILENGSKSHIFIYHCNMKSIAFPIIFHSSTTRNSMLKLLKECKKYSLNTYT